MTITDVPKDRRGASIISNLLVLPLFILVVFGSFQIWRLISIKHTLHLGTAQTVRCISMYDARNATLASCEGLLRERLRQNGLIDASTVRWETEYYRWALELDDPEWLPIGDPTTDDIPECGDPFRMKTTLHLPRSIVVPYLPEREMVLHDWKTNFVECLAVPGSISEGTPITPLN